MFYRNGCFPGVAVVSAEMVTTPVSSRNPPACIPCARIHVSWCGGSWYTWARVVKYRVLIVSAAHQPPPALSDFTMSILPRLLEVGT